MTMARYGDASWIMAVQDAVAAVGADRLAEAADGWDRFAEHQRVVATVYGPYNTAKSALIKRLLVEAGEPVPDWLTVSARRETSAVGEVEAQGIVLRDTPGTATRDKAHERLATDALALTDVLLIAWPPAVATAQHQRLAEVIGGDHFGRPADGYFPPGALIMVIGRADAAYSGDLDAVDEAGKADSVDEYRAASDAKRAELAEQLAKMRAARSLSADRDPLPVHVVCPDPLERVGSREQPSPDDYDTGRDWDGIAGLRAALAALPARLPELRAAAAVRYWSLIARQASERAAAESAASTQLAAKTAKGAEPLGALVGHLKWSKDFAAGELQRLIADELRSAGEADPQDQDAARSRLASRLDEVCATWAVKWSADVNQAVAKQRGDADRASFRDDFDTRLLAEPLDRAAAAAQSSPGERKLAAKAVNGFVSPTQGIAKGLVKLALGDTPKGVAKDLKAFDKAIAGLAAGSPEREQALAALTSFGSEADADRVRGLVRAANVADVLFPLAQLGLLFATERGKRRDERRECDRRAQQSAARVRASEEIANRILDGPPDSDQPGLGARLDLLIGELDADYREQLAAVAAAEEAADTLAATRETLDTLINERP